MMIGRVKTKVFPDPVKAMPIMSRPDRLHTNTVRSTTVLHALNPNKDHHILRGATLTLWVFLESELVLDGQSPSFLNLSELLQMLKQKYVNRRAIKPLTGVFLCEAKHGVTWRKLHLPEAFDGSGDAFSIHQDVEFLPHTFVSRVWHI